MFRSSLVALLAFALVSPLGASDIAIPDQVTGELGFVFREGGAAPEWTLRTLGRDLNIEMPTSIVASAGGFAELAGRRVSLHGRAYGSRFVADKIGWLPDSDRMLVARRRSAASERPLRSSSSGTRPQVFILAKFKDVATTPHPKSWYEGLVTGASVSLRDYFLEQSYGAWDIAGSVVTEWVTLPKTRAQYSFSGGIGVDDEAVVKDALAAADAQVDYRQFDGFHVLLNSAAGNIGGTGGRGTYTLDGETRLWGRTYDNNGDGMLGLLAHEMGHSFGFDHSSGPYATPYDSRWDQMSYGGVWERRHPDFGPYPQHTNQYHRIVTGLTARDLISECLPGANRTVQLAKTVQPAAGYMQAARIFLGGDGGHWLTVEARKRVGTYEQGATLPDEGVILHDCDPRHTMADIFTGVVGPGPISYVVDPDHNGDPNDASAVWKPGETYTDAANGVTVTVVRATSAGYDVKIVVDPSQPKPNVVTNGNDSGPGSLRGAIQYANMFPGTTIKFDVPSNRLTSGELVIKPLTPLPTITAERTTIDGTTQTAKADSNAGMPEIAIDGGNLTGWGYGLVCQGPRPIVKGISVRNMPTGGFFVDGAADGLFDGCTAGVNRTGKSAAPNGWSGFIADNHADRLTIRDLLASGNASYGAIVRNVATVKIQAGKFGTDRQGVLAIGNGYEGAYLQNVSDIDVVAYNGRYPQFSGSVNSSGLSIVDSHDGILKNVRAGNDASGRSAIPNRYSGVYLSNTQHIVVSNSVLAGNGGEGIVVQGDAPSYTSLNSLYLGTNAAGSEAVANGYGGAWIDAPNVNVTSCVLSGNKSNGLVLFTRATGNVKACKIGTDKTGSVAIPNGYKGIAVSGANGWTVGSCILSGNTQEGIAVYGGAKNGNITANKVGVGATGQALGNHWSGIWVGDGSMGVRVASNTVANIDGAGISFGNSTGSVLIGGTVSNCTNVGVSLYDGATAATVDGVTISGCKYAGVNIAGANTANNLIRNVTSDNNDWGGVQIYSGAHHNRVESSLFLRYNGCGLSASDGAHDNTFVDNTVGCQPGAPTTALHTGWSAMGAWNGAYGNVFGAVGMGNLLAAGDQIGVYVNDDTTLGNTIRGNRWYMTTRLGIDLGGNGSDSNDPNDADTGPNRKQNSPTLTKGTGAGKVNVAYRGIANHAILVDLYSVEGGRDAGSGPGCTYLGTVALTTSAGGTASATFTAPAGVTRVTAVATDVATGDSSEFAVNSSVG